MKHIFKIIWIWNSINGAQNKKNQGAPKNQLLQNSWYYKINISIGLKYKTYSANGFIYYVCHNMKPIYMFP